VWSSFALTEKTTMRRALTRMIVLKKTAKGSTASIAPNTVA
jgi:hypothetical protein